MFSPRNIYSPLPGLLVCHVHFQTPLYSSASFPGWSLGPGDNRKPFLGGPWLPNWPWLPRQSSKKLEAYLTEKSDELCVKFVAPRKPEHGIGILSGIPGLQDYTPDNPKVHRHAFFSRLKTDLWQDSCGPCLSRLGSFTLFQVTLSSFTLIPQLCCLSTQRDHQPENDWWIFTVLGQHALEELAPPTVRNLLQSHRLSSNVPTGLWSRIWSSLPSPSSVVTFNPHPEVWPVRVGISGKHKVKGVLQTWIPCKERQSIPRVQLKNTDCMIQCFLLKYTIEINFTF